MWQKVKEGKDSGYHFCTACGQPAMNYYEDRDTVEILTPFCPWCGDKTGQNESVVHTCTGVFVWKEKAD